MNKEWNFPIINKKTIFGSFALKFAREHKKKAISIGACLCMGTTSLTFASLQKSNFYDQSLNSSYSQLVSEQHNIEAIREELIEKNRELHEYKAKLFRASHPQDLAKIKELNQKIAENEKTIENLTAKVNDFEKTLFEANKQINILNVSTESLTGYIQHQQIALGNEKKELLNKIQAYEEDYRLENEQKLNEKLAADLSTLQSAIASYERQINDLEKKYEIELQDALQDSAMLKFELADFRHSSEQNELEQTNFSLNHLTMALDHADGLKTKLTSNQARLSTLKNQILAFQERIDQEEAIKSNLLEEKELLLRQYEEEKYLLEHAIREKEDELENHQIAYALKQNLESHLNDHLAQIQAEHEDIKLNLMDEKEGILSQRQVEQELFANAIREKEEELEQYRSISDQETNSLKDLLSENNSMIDTLKQEVAKLNADFEAVQQDLAREKELILAQHDAEKQLLANTLKEKEEELHQFQLVAGQEANDMKSQLDEDLSMVETLKQEIAKLNADFEAAQQDLAREKELILAQHDAEKQLLANTLKEKEEELLQFQLVTSQEANDMKSQLDEDLSMMETLKQEIAKLNADFEASQQDLAREKELILAQHDAEKQLLANTLKEKEEELLQFQIVAGQEANDMKSQLNEDLSMVETLKQEVAKLNADFEAAQQDLAREKELIFAQHDAEKQLLANTLKEKEEELHQFQLIAGQEANDMRSQLDEDLSMVETLKQEITKLNADFEAAQQDLAREKELILAQHDAEKQLLANTLKEKEEELHQFQLVAGQEANDMKSQLDEDLSMVETLKQEVAKLNADFEAAQQDLAREKELILAQHDAEKQLLANTLKEKEEELHQFQLVASQEANDMKSQLDEDLSMVEMLKQEVAKLNADFEASQQDLAREKELILSQHDAEKQLFANTLKEKEEELHQFQLVARQEANDMRSQLDEDLSMVEMLKQEVAKLNADFEAAQEDLAREKELILSQHDAEKQLFANTLKEKEEELHQFQLVARQEANDMRSQLDEDHSMMETLKQEVARLNADFESKILKEKELEVVVQNLAQIAEHQDRALAEANAAFSTIREYSYKLESENTDLNKRLDVLEIAERLKRKSNSNNEDNENLNFISPVLLQLMKSSSGQ